MKQKTLLGFSSGRRAFWPAEVSLVVNLVAHVKTTNGAGTLTGLNRSETAAFAAEIV